MILQILFTSLIIIVNARTVVDGGLFSEFFDLLHDGPSRSESELNKQSENNRTVCQTEECRTIANVIRSNMDKTVDPCDDFYQYACGNVNYSSMGNPFWDKHRELAVQEAVKIIRSTKEPDDPPAVKFMKNYFHSCVDAVNIEKQGVGALFTTLTRIGGWPLLMNPEYWDEKEFTWQKVDNYYARLIGQHTFFLIKSQQFSRTDNAVLIAPPTPIQDTDSKFTEYKDDIEVETEANPCSSEDNEINDIIKKALYDIRENQYYGSKSAGTKKRKSNNYAKSYAPESAEEELSAEEMYANYVKEVARSLANLGSIQLSEEQLAKDVDDMLHFYIELLKIIKKKRNNAEDPWVEYDLDGWEEMYNNGTGKNSMIKWEDKLQYFFNDADVNVDLSNTEVGICNVEYFLELRALLDNTPKRTIVNYVHWYFLSKVLKTSTRKLRSLSLFWEDTDESTAERYDSCSQELLKSDMVAYEYVRKTKDLSKFVQMAKDTIDDIHREIEHQIKHAKWLDEKTKDYVLSKLVYMNTYIGYPKWINDTAVVNHYFGGLTSGLTYFENFLTYSRFKRFKQSRSISSTYQFKGVISNIMEVTALYDQVFNTVIIPAAVLKSQFIAVDRPIAVNFAIIGEFLGHETNHGFDNDGIKYDKSGYELNETSTIRVDEYMKRAQCFIDQFNNYSLMKDKDVKIKNYGVKTLAENIADTMGLQAAFKGFKRQERKCGKKNVALPGLEEFNDDQIFFLTYATTDCDGNPETVDDVLWAAEDGHSVDRLRLIGTVSNSNDFAKAFNCPIGSPMNPEKKCNIWE